MSFTNFSTGDTHSPGGQYLELLPFERIRHTDGFDDPNLPGMMVTTSTHRRSPMEFTCGCLQLHTFW